MRSQQKLSMCETVTKMITCQNGSSITTLPTFISFHTVYPSLGRSFIALHNQQLVSLCFAVVWAGGLFSVLGSEGFEERRVKGSGVSQWSSTLWKWGKRVWNPSLKDDLSAKMLFPMFWRQNWFIRYKERCFPLFQVFLACCPKELLPTSCLS